MNPRWMIVSGVLVLAAARFAAAAIVVGPPEAPPSAAGGGAATSAAVPSSPLEPGGDRLTLLKGDWLRGELVSIDAAGGRVLWRHPEVREPVAFSAKAVGEIRLGAREGAAPARGSGVVRLTNGDELAGDIVAVDPTNLVLATSAAGALALQRSMVAEIRPGAGAMSVLYEGPKSLDEWKLRGGDRTRMWELKDGVLSPLVPVPLGRSIDTMPDSVRIDFTVEWRQPGIYFSFWFFHEKPDEPQGEAYMLNIISGQRVDLNRLRSTGGSQNLGSAEFAEGSQQRGTARISLLADRAKGTIVLLLNGRMLRQWKDTREFKGGGKSITFMPQGGRELRISEIRVSKWNGIVPQGAEVATDTPDDAVVLTNGDVMSGTLLEIAGGQAVVKTPFAELKIPLDRITQISMAGAKAVRARRKAGDVRASFPGGGSVTVDLASLAGGRLQGASENFGTAAWPLSSFERIEMNIYAEKPAAPDEP